MRGLLNVVAALVLLPVLSPNAIAQSDYQRQQSSQLCAQAYSIGIQQQNYAAGISLLMQAQALTPNDHWIPATIASCYLHLNRYADAVPYLERAIALPPTEASEIEDITFCYARLKRPRKVLQYGEPYLTQYGYSPSTVNIWQRVAHALASLGDYANSYGAYKRYLAFHPDEPAAWYAACQDLQTPAAAQYLSQLYSEYARRFPDHVGVEYMAQKCRLMTEMSKSAQSASEVDPVDRLIAPHDPKTSAVSREFYGMVKEGLRTLPESLWKPLLEDGYSIKLAQYVTDVKSGIADTHPSGYQAESTFRNVPGIFDFENKAIIISEFSLGSGGKPEPNYDPAEAMCHEFGHAFDMYLGNPADKAKQSPSVLFSKGKTFSDAYQSDIASVPESSKSKLSYFCQPYPNGQMEVFAQLFPILYDDSAIIGSQDDLLSRSFPRSLSLLYSTLNREPHPARQILQARPPVPFAPPINKPQ